MTTNVSWLSYRVAWAIVDDQKNVQVISTWPGAGNSKFDQAYFFCDAIITNAISRVQCEDTNPHGFS